MSRSSQKLNTGSTTLIQMNANSGQWDGEDGEDESVKDSWDQDSDDENCRANAEADENQKQTLPTAQPAGTKKSLKKICKRFEEKEKKRLEEATERRKAEIAAAAALGPNSRRRRLREGADLSIAKEVYGVSSLNENSSLRNSS